jgi:outer membrane murein-binding lipoprotein Lpp
MKMVMFVRALCVVILLSAVIAFLGCGENEQNKSNLTEISKENVKQDTKEAYEATKTYTQEQMQNFREQTVSRLAEYKIKIDQLQEKMEKMAGDVKAKAEPQLAALRQKQDEVSEKFKEMSSSSTDMWEQLKSGIDVAMEELGNAFKKAAAEFSKS